MYRLLQLAVLAMGLALTSCQVLANIESHPVDPLPDKCTLTTPGAKDNKIRLANWLASDAKIDVCMRVTGTSSYGRPVLRSSGRGKETICGGGLAYGQATTPFKAPSTSQSLNETVDFKVITAGLTCAAPALAERSGVALGPDFVKTISFLGGKGVTPIITAYTESPPSANESQNRRIRIVNAIPGYAIQFGIGLAKKLPTTITDTKFNVNALEFGHIVDKGEKGIPLFDYDEFGYLTAPSQGANVVAVQRGQTKALLQLVYEGAGTYSLISVGDPAGGVPIRGLLCRDIDISNSSSTADCRFSELENFSIDVFNAGLYGARAPVESARAPEVITRLAARGTTSDLLCVSELARHQNPELPSTQQGWTQEGLIDAAGQVADGYRYFASAKTDLDTKLSDPTNQQGEIPPEPGRAPCDADADPARIEAVYQCSKDNCSTDPVNKGAGVSQGGATCYSSNCSSPLSFLLYGDDKQRQCYLCWLLNALSYKTWDRNREICTTDKRRPFGFDGASSSMLLSKYPLNDQDQFVLSATAFRRTAVYASMEYDVGKSIDVYCVHAPPLLGSQVAYTGGYAYNASLTTGAAWYEEQKWAVKRFIEWVKQKSGDRPAIIMGDWSASRKAYDKNGMEIHGLDDLPIVADVNPETIQSMQEAFLEAYPTPAPPLLPYTPECTRCPEKRDRERSNIYNGGIEPQWSLRVYMKSPWFENPATDASLFYTDSDVAINDATYGIFGPLSDNYGYNVRLRRPPN